METPIALRIATAPDVGPTTRIALRRLSRLEVLASHYFISANVQEHKHVKVTDP